MKNKKFLALAGVAALAVVGGSFAYYSSTNEFSNEFDTTNYSTSSTEKFNPNGDNKDWKPGVEVDKEVYATNTGEGDVWVRIRFDEMWTRNGEMISEWKSQNDGFNPDSSTAASSASIGDHQVQTGELTGDKDGRIDVDEGSVVFKKFAENYTNDWYFKDGYYYYKKVLKQKETTSKLLDSVTLCDDTDMGRFDEPVYYKAVEKDAAAPVFDETSWNKNLTGQNFDGWTWGVPSKEDEALKGKDVYTYKGKILDQELPGYANADYELDITVDFLQTNKDGKIAETAGWDLDALKEAGLLTEAFEAEEPDDTPAEG